MRGNGTVSVYGFAARDIPMIRDAVKAGLGIGDPARIRAVGNAADLPGSVRLKGSRGRFLQRLPRSLFLPVTWLMTYRPQIDEDLCIRCGICVDTCSQKAITVTRDRTDIDRAKCILCMCCMESCPKHAINVRSPAFALRRLSRKLRGKA